MLHEEVYEVSTNDCRGVMELQMASHYSPRVRKTAFRFPDRGSMQTWLVGWHRGRYAFCGYLLNASSE